MSSLTPQTASQNNADPNSNVYLPEESGALVLAVGQARSRREITLGSGGDRREFLRVSVLSLRRWQETPAARAGFRKFDLIVEIDGKAVKTAADAQSIVDSAKVGQQMQASPNCCEVCAWRSAVCAVFPIALPISWWLVLAVLGIRVHVAGVTAPRPEDDLADRDHC